MAFVAHAAEVAFLQQGIKGIGASNVDGRQNVPNQALHIVRPSSPGLSNKGLKFKDAARWYGVLLSRDQGLCMCRKQRGGAVQAKVSLNNSPTDLSSDLNFQEGQLLSELTTWGIGGPAKMLIEVSSAAQMAQVVRYCKEHDVPTFVLGKGSNCLFDDRGFNGCVILNRIDFVEHDGNGTFHVGAGHPFNQLGVTTSKAGWSGMEFAAGIPGTVGGAVFMNAGANSRETSDSLVSVEVVDKDGRLRTLRADRGELPSRYRHSVFQDRPGEDIICAATFKLTRCESSRQRQVEYLAHRYQTQPVSERSVGCVFRNPATPPLIAGTSADRDATKSVDTTKCLSAGALIEQGGLKGAAVGNARVSEKHANFLINVGGCKAAEMRDLIDRVKREVREKFGLELQEEVRFVPYDPRVTS
eukprot:jgi/Mesvir1/26976/Mv20689-RA.1